MTSCMSVGRSLYRMNDPDKEKREGSLLVQSFDEASFWNARHWGIFWTVNQFNGPRRKVNLTQILSWATEIDGKDKLEMIRRIMRFLKPSAVIESKNGFHVYYDAIDATVETWDTIVGERLVYHLEGDPNAKDLSRTLRVPGFLHWKDPSDPFAVKLVHYSDARYTEDEMLKAFPLPPKQETESREKIEFRRNLKFQKDDSLWERIYSIDCRDALVRVSGSACVCSEKFSFKRVSNGNLNILVNGKSTSCFVDKEGRIGSSDQGGPTIWQWINWYQRDHKKTFEAIKQHFPEVING